MPSVAKHAVQQHGSEETYLREVNDTHRAICNEEFKNNKTSKVQIAGRSAEIHFLRVQEGGNWEYRIIFDRIQKKNGDFKTPEPRSMVLANYQDREYPVVHYSKQS